MFHKVLTDLHAEIDLPIPRWARTLEERAGEFEKEARDLQEFLRDHRSRDHYFIQIIREYTSVCEFCGETEERDTDGTPVCCEKAGDEFAQRKKVADVGIK